MYMYCEYFGLHEPPFSIAPNPRYLYMSDQHEEALSHLLYGIQADGGFILLTGEVGTGKTTLSRRLIEQLPDTTDFALILNPHLQPVELLQAICDELHIDPGRYQSASMKALCDAIYHFLLQQHAQGRNTLLIVDEAQQLPFASLEQLRLLTNLETSEAKLLKVVLLGQPELLERLAQEELRQLSQRISARFHLGPLAEADLPNYIDHRLRIAGLSRPVFPPATLKCLYRLSAGLPRVVNQICDRAMLGTYVQTRNEVSVETLQRAAREVLGQDAEVVRSAAQRPLYLWLAGGLLVGLLGWAVGLGLSLLYSDRLAWPPWQGWLSQPEATVMTEAEAYVLRARLYPWEKVAPVAAEEVMLSSSPGGGAAIDTGGPSDSTDVAGDEWPLLTPVYAESMAVDTNTEQPNPAVITPDWDSVERWQRPDDPDLAEAQAFRELFALWQQRYDPRSEPVVCDFAARHRLGCLTLQGDLQLVERLDRPAVITLNDRDQPYAALLIRLDAESALIRVGHEERPVSRAILEQLWGGSLTLLWQLPPGYREPLWPGAEGKEVVWLRQQLGGHRGVTIDGPPQSRYDAKLLLQVKAFQQKQGLKVDGVAGPLTLIQLNSLVRAGLPRLSS